jgi:hypothetical protein
MHIGASDIQWEHRLVLADQSMPWFATALMISGFLVGWHICKQEAGGIRAGTAALLAGRDDSFVTEMQRIMERRRPSFLTVGILGAIIGLFVAFRWMRSDARSITANKVAPVLCMCILASISPLIVCAIFVSGARSARSTKTPIEQSESMDTAAKGIPAALLTILCMSIALPFITDVYRSFVMRNATYGASRYT